MTVPEQLGALRRQVDETNERLLELLNERGALIRDIGRIKTANDLALRDETREVQELRHLAELNRGPYSDAEIEEVFRSIFNASMSLMQRGGPL